MTTTANTVAVVILAAGLGTRMKSTKAKVLHSVLNQPMITYVVNTAAKVVVNNIILVVGNQAQEVRAIVSKSDDVQYAIQAQQLGTGHAVKCALPYIPRDISDVVILYGDVPLLTPDTVKQLVKSHQTAQQDVTLLAVELEDPFGYGRILHDKHGQLCGIVEEADATAQQKRIKLINTGIYCVQRTFLTEALAQIKSDNKQGEYYLTDIIGIGYAYQKKLGCLIGHDGEETLGVNTIADLMRVESIMQERQRNRT